MSKRAQTKAVFLYDPENQAKEAFQRVVAIHGAGAGGGCPWQIKGEKNWDFCKYVLPQGASEPLSWTLTGDVSVNILMNAISLNYQDSH